MPTIMTHAYVPLALGLGLGSRLLSTRLIIAGALFAMVPDLDTITFRLGIAYASPFGHRGMTHSLTFALLLALFAMPWSRYLHSTPLRTFLFLSLATASHGVLDLFTNGGLGIALVWPWSDTRYFAPLRLIEVSPIGLKAFLTERGLAVLRSEFITVWIPTTVLALVLAVVMRERSRRTTTD